MATDSETRTLEGGELLHLVRSPGEKWRITALDHHLHSGRVGESVSAPNGVVRTGTGKIARNPLPASWAEMKFDSIDEAVAFAESEIEAVAT